MAKEADEAFRYASTSRWSWRQKITQISVANPVLFLYTGGRRRQRRGGMASEGE
jgi:hypothetical protein